MGYCQSGDAVFLDQRAFLSVFDWNNVMTSSGSDSGHWVELEGPIRGCPNVVDVIAVTRRYRFRAGACTYSPCDTAD